MQYLSIAQKMLGVKRVAKIADAKGVSYIIPAKPDADGLLLPRNQGDNLIRFGSI